MNFRIRNAVREDVPHILRIVNHEVLNSLAIYDTTERTYEYQLSWFEEKTRKKMPVIVAEKDGEVIGFGTFGIFRPWEAYRFSAEHSIYVHSGWRGLGIGKQLLTELIALAQKLGFHTMIAGIDSSNVSSIEFHRRHGFKDIGVCKQVGYKFDKWLDLNFASVDVVDDRKK